MVFPRPPGKFTKFGVVLCLSSPSRLPVTVYPASAQVMTNTQLMLRPEQLR